MEYKDKNFLQALLDAFNSDPVDAFGSAKAELDLAKEKYENARLNLLDQKTFGKHQGDLFEANIIEVKESTRIDNVALIKDLIKNGKISDHYIKKHTKNIPSNSRLTVKYLGGK